MELRSRTYKTAADFRLYGCYTVLPGKPVYYERNENKNQRQELEGKEGKEKKMSATCLDRSGGRKYVLYRLKAHNPKISNKNPGNTV
jgi:hypothetical protein